MDVTLSESGLLYLEEAVGLLYSGGVRSYGSQDQLTLTESVTEGHGGTYGSGPPTSDRLRFVESLSYTLLPDPLRASVTDSIQVGSVGSPGRVKPSTQTVSVKETIGVGLTLPRGVTEQLTFSEESSFYIPNVSWVNPGTPTPIPQSVLLLTDTTGTAGTVSLRLPEFGDTTKYLQTRIQRNDRGGELEVFNDPMWPNSEIYHFEFEYLDGGAAATLLSFLSNTLGRHIHLTDHYGKVCIGYLITPEDSILQPKVHGFGAKFDLQIKEG